MSINKFIIWIVITLCGVLLKHFIVNSRDGMKYTKREFMIDFVVFTIIIFGISKFNLVSVIVKVIVLLTYLIAFTEQGQIYAERKSFTGSVVVSILLLSFAIIILESLFFRKFNIDDSILPSLCLNLMLVFFTLIWAIMTSELAQKSSVKNRIMCFCNNVYYLFKHMQINKFEYFALVSICTLPIINVMVGNYIFGNVNFLGVHEIARGRKKKGIVYLIIGQSIIIINNINKLIGGAVYLIYIVFLIADVFLQLKKWKINKAVLN